jgi:hypothetical protein
VNFEIFFKKMSQCIGDGVDENPDPGFSLQRTSPCLNSTPDADVIPMKVVVKFKLALRRKSTLKLMMELLLLLLWFCQVACCSAAAHGIHHPKPG